MKRLLSFLLLAILIAGGQAIAQVDPDTDGIGIYADQGAMTNAITATPGDEIEVYLVMTRPSVTAANLGIAAWECKLVVPSNVFVWGWNIPGQNWLNAGSPPDFIVAYGRDPLAISNAVLLMTFIIRVTDTSPALFYIQASWLNSGQCNLPVYLAKDNLSRLIPLHPYPDGPDQPSFKVNPDATPIQAASWGEIKTLYE